MDLKSKEKEKIDNAQPKPPPTIPSRFKPKK
jgi:hypothetical protein